LRVQYKLNPGGQILHISVSLTYQHCEHQFLPELHFQQITNEMNQLAEDTSAFISKPNLPRIPAAPLLSFLKRAFVLAHSKQDSMILRYIYIFFASVG
jgi:hypothetical protein